MFTHIPFRLPRLKTRNFRGHRYYQTPDGKLYPSVTTVLSIIDKEGLDKWKKQVGEGYAEAVSFRATSIGSELHKIIEEYLNNEDPYEEHKKLLPRAHFENIKEYVDRIDNIRCQEASLFSHDLQLAGRVDCVADFDNKISVIDFKTSTKQKKEEWIERYFLQETAYSIMWEEMTGKQINQIVTIISGEDGSKDVFVKNRDNYKVRLREVINEWKKD